LKKRVKWEGSCHVRGGEQGFERHSQESADDLVGADGPRARILPLKKEKTVKKAYRLEWVYFDPEKRLSMQGVEDVDTMFEASSRMQALLMEDQAVGAITLRRRIGG